MTRRPAMLLVALMLPAVLVMTTFSVSGAGTGPAYKPAFASLLGANEISEDGQKNAGDEDGEGSFALSAGGTSICYAYVVKAIETPTAAHIHKAKAGQNGDVVLPLGTPTSGDPGTIAECLQNQDEALIEDIVEHPARYYANVHTADFPNGAIRGQLQRLPKKV
jgi:CHRD domain